MKSDLHSYIPIATDRCFASTGAKTSLQRDGSCAYFYTRIAHVLRREGLLKYEGHNENQTTVRRLGKLEGAGIAAVW